MGKRKPPKPKPKKSKSKKKGPTPKWAWPVFIAGILIAVLGFSIVPAVFGDSPGYNGVLMGGASLVIGVLMALFGIREIRG